MNKENNYNFYANGYNEEYFKKRSERDRLGQICMTLGIISVSSCFLCPCLPALILGIISLVYYSKAKKVLPGEKASGQLLAGLICSIIGISISALYTLLSIIYLCLFCIGMVGSMFFFAL